MKSLGVILLCFVLYINLETTNAAVYTMKSDKGSEHLGDCYTSTYDIGSMKSGEMKTIKGQCARVECLGGTMEVASCGKAMTLPPCVMLDEDLTKNYPDCCPTAHCPERQK